MDRKIQMSEQPRAELLTDSQKTCLRLVSAGMSSKEIAIETGLTPATIDQYLSRATIALGTSNRREAARAFAEQESGLFRKTELKPEGVEPEQNSSTVDVQMETRRAWRLWLWLRRWLRRIADKIGGDRHDLDRTGTVYAILRVSVVTVAVAGLILATFYWLNRITL